MKINIETIPHEKQRYRTLGDYFRDQDGALQIKVSDVQSAQFETLIAIHELIEQTLCDSAGISNKAIDDFDMENPELEDPGNDPRAPYHRQHTIATAVEMLLCAEMGISWSDYEHAIAARVS
jgi:hypothetical protein